MKLVTAAQMRALEAAAIEAGSSATQLMEEAGLAVAQESWMALGTLEGRRILVLAGTGNNGGDGMVAARHLTDWGAEAAVYLPNARDDDSLSAELVEREVTLIRPAADDDGRRLGELLTTADLVIDALLGIGVSRPIEPDSPIGMTLSALQAARTGFNPPKLLAVDVPSGVHADSGAADPLVVAPDTTVTFGLPKVGMYQAPASGVVGRVEVIDIGIPAAAAAKVGLELMTARWARGLAPKRPESANKGTFGKVLVVGGSSDYRGAPRLTALGAYRAGAGLVTVAATPVVVNSVAIGLPEATLLSIGADDATSLPETAAIDLRARWHDFSAAVIGPGMGTGEGAGALLWAALPDLGELAYGCVIDADALNALAAMPDGVDRLPANAVLTPHPGEMARLMDMSVSDVQADRLATAQAAAKKFGCTIVLKGAHSVVAAADGTTLLSPFANPLLATAGSGDVLAGMIGGYLAQGMSPFEAAGFGVYLHGAAGESLRGEMGNSGLLASEIAGRLPVITKELLQA